MGGIVSALTGGVSGNSGAAGINYSADQANLMEPVNQAQIDASRTGVDQQQQQQQQLLQALQAQNGIGNQSSAFNQLQGVANGTGPNPAQAQLAQSTGANVANQASLMAGQRGSGQNVGLMSRQVAQQGAATQQQAAGQAATLQAQQSLGAIQGLGTLATQQVGQQMGQQSQVAGYQQAQEGQLLGAAANYNSAQTGSQASVNSANSMIANNVATQQGKMFGSLTGAGAGGIMSILAEGGEVGDAPKKMASGGGTGPASEVMDNSQPSPFDSPALASVAPPTAPTVATAGTGPMSRIGQYMKSTLGPQGQQQGQQAAAPQSDFQQGYQFGNDLGNKIKGYFSSPATPDAATDSEGYMPDGSYNDSSEMPGEAEAGGAADTVSDAGELMAAEGGKVKALLSPGERYLPPSAVKKVEKGANPMKEGKKVPGTPKVKGAKNSYANDTVKANLDEGGIVLPRSVTQHKNPDWAAHAFVRGIMAKNRQGLKK